MTCGVALLAVAVAAAQGPAAKIEMDPPLTVAFAGAKVAVPKGFGLQTPDEPTTVLHAVESQGGQPVAQVRLWAVRLKPDTSLFSFVRAFRLKSDLVFRDVKLLKSGPLEVAGQKGEIRIVTYDYRGVETTAVSVYLLYETPDKSMLMGYILTVEGTKAAGPRLLPILAAVGNTLELTKPVRPVSEKITSLGEPVKSERWGYSLRPPMLWKARFGAGRDSLLMYQTDYSLGGAAMPQGFLFVRADTGTPEECGKAALGKLREDFKSKNQEFHVVREGASRMAGREAYEFVLRQKIPTTAPGGERTPIPVLAAERTVCNAGHSYSLVLFFQSEQTEDLVAAMDKIAEGVELMTPVGGEAAPSSGPATGPGGAGPATRPTTAPGGFIMPGYE